jgi:hypothetical protein
LHRAVGAYASLDDADELAFLDAVGFHELTRTERVWQARPDAVRRAKLGRDAVT